MSDPTNTPDPDDPTVDGGTADESRQPEPEPPSARKQAASDAKGVVSAAAAGAASAAAKSVVFGAATAGTGTAAAAGIGAVKAAAVVAIKSRTGRNIIAGTLVIAFLLIAGIPLTAIVMFQVSATSQAAANSETSQQSLELSDSEVSTAAATTQQLAVPWELLIVGRDVFDEVHPDWTPRMLDDELRNADPTGNYLDPRAGLIWTGSGYREAGDADADQASLNALHERVEATYLAALTAFGLDETQAARVWAELQDAIRGGQDCPAPGNPTPSPTDSGGRSQSDMTAAQQENVTTIIGIARTMGGDDWEHLALTALTVAYTESRWRVLANDGVIDHDYERARFDEWPQDLYPLAATSATYEHDGVGSQYVALGMFQQMMNGRWGATETSTFADDPEGVIARLMTAEWSTYAFLRAATAIDGWQTMDAAELGEAVQVSGNIAATQANIVHGQEALDANRDAPALPLPDGAVAVNPDASTESGNCGNGGAPQTGSGEWLFPVPSGTFSSAYGPRGTTCVGGTCTLQPHKGIDISAACNAPILAADAGTVTDVSEEPWGATQIWVDHGNGYLTRYVHMEPDGVYVGIGDGVSAGQEIAGIGSSGFSTGCHLHFEMWLNGQHIDPAPLVGTTP